MMVGEPLVDTTAAVGTTVYSKRLRLTVTWSASSSGSSATAEGKEGRRAAQIQVRNGAILYYHQIAAACAVSRVYATGGER